MSTSSIHEDYSRGHLRAPSSNRSFGFVFTGFFLLVGAFPALHHRPLRLWALAAAALFLVTALARPSTLAPLNRIWTGLGLLLGRVVNPIVTGLIFLILFTPAAWFMKLLRRDALRLQPQPELDSYWIPRASTDVSPEGMRRQF